MNAEQLYDYVEYETGALRSVVFYREGGTPVATVFLPEVQISKRAVAEEEITAELREQFLQIAIDADRAHRRMG